MSFSLDGQDTNCRVKWNEATGLHPGADGNWNGTAGFGGDLSRLLDDFLRKIR